MKNTTITATSYAMHRGSRNVAARVDQETTLHALGRCIKAAVLIAPAVILTIVLFAL